MYPLGRELNVLDEIFPRLNCSVFLEEKIWKYKILVDHPEMDGKLNLIKDTLKNCPKNAQGEGVYEKTNNPEKFFIQRKTPHFLPLNDFLRITLGWTDSSRSRACITSAYPVNGLPAKGVKPL